MRGQGPSRRLAASCVALCITYLLLTWCVLWPVVCLIVSSFFVSKFPGVSPRLLYVCTHVSFLNCGGPRKLGPAKYQCPP